MSYHTMPMVTVDTTARTRVANRHSMRRRLVLREDGPEYGESTAEPDPEPSAASPGFPEAAKVHALIKSAQTVTNGGHLVHIEGLRVLYDCYHFYELGYSSFSQYCDRELGLKRSTALEYVRVARALEKLPRLRVLYREGELSWQQVRAITRVATPKSEATWIKFAFDQPCRVLYAEIREAAREARNAPRDRRYGLPNLRVRLSIELTLEEKERVRAAFELVGSCMGNDLGGGPGDGAPRRRSGDDENGSLADSDDDHRPPLVRWADAILAGAIPACPVAPDGETAAGADNGSDAGANGSAKAASNGRAKPPSPAQTILYRICPQCRAATIDTAEGPVSVPPERVVELGSVANHVEITAEDELPAEALPDGEVDKPNSTRLTRQVLHRDGLQCANPGCGSRRNLQAHHIVYRSEGGRTVLANEVTVCRTCHSLLHKGLLEVTGSPETGLTWQPRPLDPSAKVRDVEALHERLHELEEELPTSQVATAFDPLSDGAYDPTVGPLPSALPAPLAEIGVPQTHGTAAPVPRGDSALGNFRYRVEYLATGLERLGWGKRESTDQVAWAIREMLSELYAENGKATPLEELDDADILMKALRG